MITFFKLNLKTFKIIMIRLLQKAGSSLAYNGTTCKSQVCHKFYFSSKVFPKEVSASQSKKRLYEKLIEEKKHKIDVYAISMLIIPIASFALGVWQVKRKAWKEGLIEELKARTSRQPVALPKSLEDLESMEYCPVTVKGKFHHDRELYMGPRTLLLEEGKLNVPSGLAFRSKVGYLVVTPFELSDSGKTILVNRGWIPSETYKTRRRYKENDTNTEVELTGLVRLNEKRPPLGMRNSPESRLFVYRDLPKMAEIANTEPIFIDATASSTVPGGPIGGQSRVSLRNEHFSYIVTWFGLSAITGGIWYLKYIRFPHLCMESDHDLKVLRIFD